MMPHCTRDSQFELFASESHAAALAPKLALPAQRTSEIDLYRLTRILAIARNTARRMLKAGLIEGRKEGKFWRIEYGSVVAYCDNLRLRYAISPRSVAAPRNLRPRDRDLLPFPADETILIAEVEDILECSKSKVLSLVSHCQLVAYQVLDTPGCPWRIHRRSLERYVAHLHAEAGRTLHPGIR